MQTLSNPIEQNESTRNYARAFFYGFLARGFEYPTPLIWDWLADEQTRVALKRSIIDAYSSEETKLLEGVDLFFSTLSGESLEGFRAEYHAAFGHAARGRCPMNEIDYGELKADPLFQPHRLADIAAFYRAFGMQLAADAAERQDHVSIECEFMSVLAAKEAFAVQNREHVTMLEFCRDAEKKFLKEHLGRWYPIFTRQVARQMNEGPLKALVDLGEAWLEKECESLSIDRSGDELFVRPTEEDDFLCGSCGINQLPAGATQEGC